MCVCVCVGGGGGGGGGGDSPRMRSGWSGMRALSQILSDESLSHSLKHFYAGTLTSHFIEEHSSPTCIFPVFMMTSSKGNMFRVTGFCAGNSRVTAGNSPVTGEFPSHRPVTRSFDAFFDLRLNKRLSKQPRRHSAHYDVTVMWLYVPNSDPVIRAAVGSFGVQRVTLVQFWIGGFRAVWKEWPQIWHTALPWLQFLEINYILHSAAV